MSRKGRYTIGIDLGGTKLAAALVRHDGHILDFTKVPVDMKKEKSAKKTQDRVIETIAEIVMDFKERYPKQCSLSRFQGVGLASAGPLNVEQGTLIHPANFPGWKTVPLRRLVQKSIQRRGFKTEVHFQNDAIAAAYAEGWVGGARQLRSYALVTVGTGVGSGVILNGKPCQNKGAGSEFGHCLVDIRGLQRHPKNLKHFTVEGIASGTALIRRAREMGFQGSSVEELVLARSTKYQVLYDDMAWALAGLCYNLSIGFHLDAIFFSGGLIKIRDLYFPQTKERYKKMVREFNPLFLCPLSIAKTKNQAGFLGAAYLPYL
ncbi:MAG: ROK family protein [Bdellovibrio sp. CG10_big_fil_rev_8_21_14_0_10_47_8]|nr:MAG: ROK family protein [Bdellovibrio sp. CG10_big_fil_rev_8_21_14_0_10_47_8]